MGATGGGELRGTLSEGSQVAAVAVPVVALGSNGRGRFDPPPDGVVVTAGSDMIVQTKKDVVGNQSSKPNENAGVTVASQVRRVVFRADAEGVRNAAWWETFLALHPFRSSNGHDIAKTFGEPII